MDRTPRTDPGAGAARPRVLARVAALARLAFLAAPLAFLAAAGIARRWMSDDGFINLRVARNILAGDGPVFNVGERVESVTSPLWIGVLALAGALRLPLEPAAVWLGIALGVAGAALAVAGALHVDGAPRPLRTAAAQRAYAPVGLAAFAAIPAVWDFLSSG